MSPSLDLLMNLWYQLLEKNELRALAMVILYVPLSFCIPLLFNNFRISSLSTDPLSVLSCLGGGVGLFLPTPPLDGLC